MVYLTAFLLNLMSLAVCLSSATPDISITNRIILIRHAEKGFTPDQAAGSAIPQKRSWPPWGPPSRGPPGEGGGRGKFPNGLSDKGRERAQYLRTVGEYLHPTRKRDFYPQYFGNQSEHNIGLIFAAPRDEDVTEMERTYATVLPLSRDLGLDIDISCANAESSCIVDAVHKFAQTSDADILICWKHFFLNGIATALGANNARLTYPDERNDVVWIMQGSQIVEKRSQHCPGLDDGRVDEGDPDLANEKPDEPWRIWLILRWLFSWL